MFHCKPQLLEAQQCETAGPPNSTCNAGIWMRHLKWGPPTGNPLRYLIWAKSHLWEAGDHFDNSPRNIVFLYYILKSLAFRSFKANPAHAPQSWAVWFEQSNLKAIPHAVTIDWPHYSAGFKCLYLTVTMLLRISFSHFCTRALSSKWELSASREVINSNQHLTSPRFSCC